MNSCRVDFYSSILSEVLILNLENAALVEIFFSLINDTPNTDFRRHFKRIVREFRIEDNEVTQLFCIHETKAKNHTNNIISRFYVL